MKKMILLAIEAMAFCTCLSQTLSAQSKRNANFGQMAPVSVGSVTLNFGIGAGCEYKDDYYRAPFGMKAAVEWGLWHGGPGTVTLGAETGASFSDGGYYDNYRSNTVVIAMRSAWHYGWKVPGLDTYGGVSSALGFHHYGYRHNEDFSYNEVIPVVGAFAGASYFVGARFGFNAEAGYDITNFQVGIILKLK